MKMSKSYFDGAELHINVAVQYPNDYKELDYHLNFEYAGDAERVAAALKAYIQEQIDGGKEYVNLGSAKKKSGEIVQLFDAPITFRRSNIMAWQVKVITYGGRQPRSPMGDTAPTVKRRRKFSLLGRAIRYIMSGIEEFASQFKDSDD